MALAQVPVWLLKATRSFLRSFQWARDAADRLVLPLSCLLVVCIMQLSPCLRKLVPWSLHARESTEAAP